MIRQAHTYLAGAVSGTVLIAVAVVVFVDARLAAGVRDWPFAGLVGGDDARPRPSEAAPAKPRWPSGRRAAAAAAAAAAPRQGGGHGGGAEPGARGRRDSARRPTALPWPEPLCGGSAARPVRERLARSRPAAAEPAAAPAAAAGAGAAAAASPGRSPARSGNRCRGRHGDRRSVGRAGVAKSCEGAVNGVAGPESPVGGTVDKTVKGVDDTVGGLLGGGD